MNQTRALRVEASTLLGSARAETRSRFRYRTARGRCCDSAFWVVRQASTPKRFTLSVAYPSAPHSKATREHHESRRAVCRAFAAGHDRLVAPAARRGAVARQSRGVQYLRKQSFTGRKAHLLLAAGQAEGAHSADVREPRAREQQHASGHDDAGDRAGAEAVAAAAHGADSDPAGARRSISCLVSIGRVQPQVWSRERHL